MLGTPYTYPRSNHPRERDTQTVPDRGPRAKHANKSRRADWAIKGGGDRIAEYVTSMRLTNDRQTLIAMTNSVIRYMNSAEGQKYGVPSVNHCKNHLFEGLL